MYQLAFYAHVFVSLVALLAGSLAVAKAVLGFRKGLEYSKSSKVSAKVFLTGMYFQLVVGLVMYYLSLNRDPWVETSPIEPGNSPSIRFWEIEHIAVMIFALFLIQIAYIFIGKTKASRKKYLLIFGYFGLALILIVFTMLMAMR